MASNHFENIVVVSNDYSKTILVVMGNNQIHSLPLINVYMWRRVKIAIENSRGDDYIFNLELQSLLREKFDSLYGCGNW